MRKFSNYHTHTNFCDGTSNPEIYIQKAIELGMSNLGFSSHAPLPLQNLFTLKNENIDKYINLIKSLKHKYIGQINIFTGLEADFIPDISHDFWVFKQNFNIDYLIGSVHLVKNSENNKLWFIDGPDIEQFDRGFQVVFNNNIKKGVSAYYKQIQEMIVTQKFDIIGHFDKIKMNNMNRFFSESEDWYQQLIDETLFTIKKSGSMIEVNTRGIYKNRTVDFFPSYEILKKAYNLNIPLVVSSDAHQPDELNKIIPEAYKTIKEIGFKHIMEFDGNLWQEVQIHCD